MKKKALTLHLRDEEDAHAMSARIKELDVTISPAVLESKALHGWMVGKIPADTTILYNPRELFII